MKNLILNNIVIVVLAIVAVVVFLFMKVKNLNK